MSVVDIETDGNADPAQQIMSDEDKEFNRVYANILGAPATANTARQLFDAGVDFVRDAEKVDAIIDSQGSMHMIITNPQIIPAWMFRDAMVTYMKVLAEQFETKYTDGDMNTQRYYDCIKSLEHALNAALPVAPGKQTLLDSFEKTKKKCEVILNATI